MGISTCVSLSSSSDVSLVLQQKLIMQIRFYLPVSTRSSHAISARTGYISMMSQAVLRSCFTLWCPSRIAPDHTWIIRKSPAIRISHALASWGSVDLLAAPHAIVSEIWITFHTIPIAMTNCQWGKKKTSTRGKDDFDSSPISTSTPFTVATWGIEMGRMGFAFAPQSDELKNSVALAATAQGWKFWK